MRIFDEKGEYNTRDVELLIREYLERIGVSWEDFWKSLHVPNLRLVFLLSIQDFRENKITIDDLSTIANDLYWAGNKGWSPLDLDRMNLDLSRVLIWCSELAYYNWRKDDNPKTRESLESSLKTVSDYFEENRFLLANLRNE